MPAINVDLSDFKRLATRVLPELQRQIPYALSRAMNDTMFELRPFLRQEMEAKFEQPTRYVLNSLWVNKSNKYNLTASLGSEEFGGNPSPATIVEPHISGGGRPMKPSEQAFGSYWVPAKTAPRDSLGNIKGGDVSAMLDYFRLSSDATQWRPRESGKKPKSNTRQVSFFRAGDIVYRRVGDKYLPFVVFINAPMYTPRLDWQNKAADVFNNEFPPLFNDYYEEAVATAKRA